jgi:SAM-dependent MidA family methyltransferase
MDGHSPELIQKENTQQIQGVGLHFVSPNLQGCLSLNCLSLNALSMSETSPLLPLIIQQIQQASDRRLPFVEFMQLALYHPTHGYYSNRAKHIGATGDFFTAPHLGAAFGELLATQLVQMWSILGTPDQFTLVEMGAGQGLMAQDILRWIRQHDADCWKQLNYIIVETAPGLISAQQQQLQPEFGDRIAWRTLSELAQNPIVGCYFSNELVDAFPVHQVEWRDGLLQEVYVSIDANDQLVEILDTPSTNALADYFTQLGHQLTHFPDPYRTEVNLAALDWIQQVAQGLDRGYVLTIDYGYPTERYYSPARDRGTLQCYYQHTHHNDPYQHIGAQDITAHVDFSALAQQGAAAGLVKVGITQQAIFLMALGLGDRLHQIAQSPARDGQSMLDCLRQRDALQQLINPMGLGNFGVLIQAKGLSPAALAIPLQGFDSPIGLGTAF